MSLSNPKNIANPVERYYEWKGGDGILSYYDKENKEKIEVALPVNFVMLDQLNTVTGFHDPSQTGIYSNEVRYANDILKVKTFKNLTIAHGKWADEKEVISNQGGKFAKSVYAAEFWRDKNKQVQYRLVNFRFFGASVAPWINLKVKDDGAIITIADKVEKKKGKVVYFEPVFKKSPTNQQLLPACIELDKQLQKYLEAKLSQIEIEEEVIEDVPELDNSPANEVANSSANEDLKPESYSVDDLPF